MHQDTYARAVVSFDFVRRRINEGRGRLTPDAAGPRGGDVNTMRKFFAMGLIALLAALMAFAAGCGQKPAEETTTETPIETTTPDTGMGMPDSMVSDTGAAH